MDNQDRIKVAVQKSGRLTENSLSLLRTCGLSYSRGSDQLICFGENMPVDLLLVRDDDIPSLLAEGVCDLGIVGLNVMLEKGVEGPGLVEPRQVASLGFGQCRLSLAVPRGFEYRNAADLCGRRIATSYPRVLGQWLADKGVSADVVTLSGAVEIAPRLGRADVICDLVSTGSTLAANDLVEAEVVMESSAVLMAGDAPESSERAEWIDRLINRIEGVVRVRESKYIMLHAPRSWRERFDSSQRMDIGSPASIVRSTQMQRPSRVV